MFVTLEGIEGAGKTVAARLLAEWISSRGFEPLLTREPGGAELGRELRRILLDPARSSLSPRAELFLFLADRAQHVDEIIRPALGDNRPVICDRYIDSTLAYQGYGRGLDPLQIDYLAKASADFLTPDVTFVLDLPVEIGLKRVSLRQASSDAEGRFDNEKPEFLQKARDGFLEIARKNPKRITVIDATAPPEKILEDMTRRMSLMGFPEAARN